MTDRKPTEAEIARYVRHQQAQSGTVTGAYLDHRIRDEIRRQEVARSPHTIADERRREAAARRREQLRAQDEQDAKERERARKEQIEAELAPVKEREYRLFQAKHPDLTRTDFERKVWPVRRDELTGRESQIEAARQSLLNSNLYNL